eukprot:278191-Chlamydomonas_euryale.AAC.6
MMHEHSRIQIITLFICTHSFMKKLGFFGGVSAFLPYLRRMVEMASAQTNGRGGGGGYGTARAALRAARSSRFKPVNTCR